MEEGQEVIIDQEQEKAKALCVEFANAKVVEQAVAYSFVQEANEAIRAVAGETVYTLMEKRVANPDNNMELKTYLLKVEPHLGTKKVTITETDQVTGYVATNEKEVADEYLALSGAEVTTDMQGNIIPVENAKSFPDKKVPMVSSELGAIGTVLISVDTNDTGLGKRETGKFRTTTDPMFTSQMQIDFGQEAEIFEEEEKKRNYKEMSRARVVQIRTK